MTVGCPLVLDGGLVGGVDLHRIVPAAPQLLQLLVGQVLDHVEQPRIRAEEVLADVGAGFDGVLLVLAVDDFAHPLGEQAVVSAASSGSQSLPQITLMTFQPAPRKIASSSWMIWPLPRTGPSSRCRLQLMTKIRLSSFSRAARLMAPSDSGSSDSPSPRNAQTLLSTASSARDPRGSG